MEDKRIKKNDIIAWLSDHEQAYKDFLGAGLNQNSSLDDIIDWIFYHETLYEDYLNFFFNVDN